MNLDSFLAYPLEQLPYVFAALLLAFTIHEWAHAYTAYHFGDATAKNQGRLTLNPAAHLDPVGVLFIFLVGFGWARPVPVNRFFFKNPRLAGVLVSVAGPASNLLLAFLCMIVWNLLNGSGLIQAANGGLYGITYQLFHTVIYLNIVLFVFNLLPLPPLDGYRVIEDLVPNRIRPILTRYENYGIFIFLLLALTPLGNYVFPPLFGIAIPAVLDFMEGILNPLFP